MRITVNGVVYEVANELELLRLIAALRELQALRRTA